MWFQDASGNYRNLETGQRFVVQPVDDDRSVRTYNIVSASPQGGQHTLVSGYKEEDEARDALKEFLKKNQIKVSTIDAPEYEEDASDDDEEEEVEK